MLRWLLNKIMKWVWDFNRDTHNEAPVAVRSSNMNAEAVVRINMYTAINGRVLEVATPQTSKHGMGHDWNIECFIVAEGESLHDSLATLLLSKGVK